MVDITSNSEHLATAINGSNLSSDIKPRKEFKANLQALDKNLV